MTDFIVTDALGPPVRATSGFGPFLDVAGAFFLGRVEENFANEVDPLGQPWQPLKPATLKKKKGPSILTESGRFRSSFHLERRAPLSITVAPDKSIPYHRIHSLGGVAGFGAAIPPRPPLGASDADIQHIAILLLAHLRGLTRLTP